MTIAALNAPSVAQAQQSGTSPLRMTLQLGATTAVAYSSNPRLTATASTPATKGSEVSVQFTPSMALSTRGPLLDANVQYAVTAVSFSASPQDNTVAHTLRSAARLNLVKDRLGIEASAQYAQQALSAFSNPLVGSGSPQAGAAALNALNPNVVDVMSLQISPVLRVRVADAAQLETRYIATRVQSGQVARGAGAGLADGTVQNGHAVQAVLRGGPSVGWSLQASNQWQGFAGGRELQSGRALATLSHALSNDLSLRVGAGVERQNLQAALLLPDEFRIQSVLQAGATWTPSARTTATVDWADRFFGPSWQFGLNHRFSRLGVRLGASRSLSDGTVSLGSVSPQLRDGSSFSLADLYDQLLAIGEPDSARRDETVSRLLRARGLDGDARVVGLSQPLGPVVQDRIELGVAYVLPRQSFNLVAVRSASESVLRDPLDPGEDLARFGALTQTIVQAGLSHRLTPDSALTLSVGHLRAEALRGARPVQMLQAELNGSFRLGPRLTGVLLVRDAELQNPNLLGFQATTAGKRRDTGVAFFLVPQF